MSTGETTLSGAVRSDASPVDRGRLARDLVREVRGDVRFDDAARGAYANDASLYRQVPIGVVAPRDADAVAAALAVCRRWSALVLGRGSGTGLAGQSVNTGVVFDFSRHMHGIVDLDPDAGTARVQPGLINDHLRAAAAEHDLIFAVDPATHDRCMIGNNSCGTHSVYGGKTVDNVLELTVLAYDGTRMILGATDDEQYQQVLAGGGRPAEIFARLRSLRDRYADPVRERYPDIPCRVSGYNLDSLLPERGFDLTRALVGGESSCVLVLEAVMRSLLRPRHRARLVVGYPEVITAAEHVTDLAGGDRLLALEAFDSTVVANLHRRGEHPPGLDDVPEGVAWLLAEYGGDTVEEAGERARAASGCVESPAEPAVFTDLDRQSEVWEVRRSAIEYARVPGVSSGLAG
ncbi:MAG: FAD-binding oxidoreductase [Pseudonocardia sp.]|nr:FAD-binding oxidoreductase [Pseudonocardia sp.]